MKRHNVEVDGKLFCFLDVVNCVNFLAKRYKLNEERHNDIGGLWPVGYDERCGLTGQLLTPNDGVYIVVADEAGLPNRCISKALAVTIGFEETARRLITGWEAAKEHFHWFM